MRISKQQQLNSLSLVMVAAARAGSKGPVPRLDIRQTNIELEPPFLLLPRIMASPYDQGVG